MVLAAARKHRLHTLALAMGGDNVALEAKRLIVAVKSYAGA